MDISSALRVLRNAPTQALRDHRNETVAAFREIEARLKDVCSSHHEATHEEASVQPRCSVDQPTSSTKVARMSPTQATKLLDDLRRTSHWVLKSIKIQPDEVLRFKRPRVHDRRLGDIHRVEGDPKAGNKLKVARVLAQRSLALQGERHGSLDIESICEIASYRGKGINRGRRGKISSYVTYELAISEEDKTFAIRAVQAGIRQLVVERLLKKRLEEAGHCTTASGISAFTALVVTSFRGLAYKNIPEFLDLLLDSTSINSSLSKDGPDMDHTSPVSIADIIRETSVWFDRLQVHYDKSVDICSHSEKQRLESSSSFPLGVDRSMHHRDNNPGENSRSSDEVDNSGESNVSASLQGVGPIITDAEDASNPAQLHTSSSARVLESHAKGMLAWAKSAKIVHDGNTIQLANQCQSPCQFTVNEITSTTDTPLSNDLSDQSSLEGPTNCSALSKDMVDQPSAEGPILGVAYHPGATYALSFSKSIELTTRDQTIRSVDLQLSCSSRSNPHSTSSIASSDVSESPGSRSQGKKLCYGGTLLEAPLAERVPHDRFSPEASSVYFQLRECSHISELEGYSQEEQFSQSTSTDVGEGGISDSDNSSPTSQTSPARTNYIQQTNVAAGNIPICHGFDSSSAALGIFDAQEASTTDRKRRRILATPNSPATQIGSIPSHIVPPQQCGRLTKPLDEPAAQAALGMQFGSNSFASYDAFNPRQFGQPTMSLDDLATQSSLAMQFDSNTVGPHAVFNRRQHGRPTTSLSESTEQGTHGVQNLVDMGFRHV